MGNNKKTFKGECIMITMECDYCGHVEHYEDECSFFQGEMWGLPDDSVMCNACLEKEKVE